MQITTPNPWASSPRTLTTLFPLIFGVTFPAGLAAGVILDSRTSVNQINDSTYTYLSIASITIGCGWYDGSSFTQTASFTGLTAYMNLRFFAGHTYALTIKNNDATNSAGLMIGRITWS